MIWVAIVLVFLSFVLWVEGTRYRLTRREMDQEIDRLFGTPVRVFHYPGRARWWERPPEASLKTKPESQR